MNNVFEIIRLHLNSVTVLTGYLLFINLLGFAMMGIDKHKARRGSFRIPEGTLFAIALFGGSIGALAGMFCFHHKTRKRKFAIGMPLILIAQIVLLTLAIMHAGAVVFQ